MSHELSFTADGTAEFAYLETEGQAWHGFGQPVLEENAEDMQSWLDASNMGSWDIVKRPACDIIDGSVYEIPGKSSLRRSDTHVPLSIVGSDFQIVQPREVVSFFDDIIKSLGFQMSTCGVLYGGKRYWAQANTPYGFEINGDKVDSKLLLATGNDGIASMARFTPTRVVCNNTWNAAGLSKADTVRVTHRQQFDADKLKTALGIPNIEEMKQVCENMSRVKMTETQVMDYLATVFDISVKEEDATEMSELEQQEARLALTAQSSNAMNCFQLFNGTGRGAELVTAKGTLWGAFNSVTEFTDHHRNTRTWDARFDSAQFGTWANVKNKAWDEAIQLVA